MHRPYRHFVGKLIVRRGRLSNDVIQPFLEVDDDAEPLIDALIAEGLFDERERDWIYQTLRRGLEKQKPDDLYSGGRKLLSKDAVERGMVDEQAMAGVVALHETQPDRPFGQLLIDRGLITKPQRKLLEEALNTRFFNCAVCGGLARRRENQSTHCKRCGWPREREFEAVTLVAGEEVSSSAEDPLLGRTLGRCTLRRLLGRGGMGAVYLARHATLDIDVAVKVLPPTLALQPGWRDRFVREAQMAARLDHPHAVRVLDVATDDGIDYLTMEYVEGRTLYSRLKRKGPLPTNEALELIRQAASALAAAHKAGIVHRDIKPENLLLTKDGQVKVADFGLAREVSGSSLSMTGQVTGSPGYMSPEQCQGLELDHRTDIFSLGVTLYALLQGSTPFSGPDRNLLAALQATVTDEIPPLPPEIPRPVQALIDRMTTKDPDLRLSSMAEIVEMLKALAAGKTPKGLRSQRPRSRENAPVSGAQRALEFASQWHNSPQGLLVGLVGIVCALGVALALLAFGLASMFEGDGSGDGGDDEVVVVDGGESSAEGGEDGGAATGSGASETAAERYGRVIYEADKLAKDAYGARLAVYQKYLATEPPSRWRDQVRERARRDRAQLEKRGMAERARAWHPVRDHASRLIAQAQFVDAKLHVDRFLAATPAGTTSGERQAWRREFAMMVEHGERQYVKVAGREFSTALSRRDFDRAERQVRALEGSGRDKLTAMGKMLRAQLEKARKAPVPLSRSLERVLVIIRQSIRAGQPESVYGYAEYRGLKDWADSNRRDPRAIEVRALRLHRKASKQVLEALRNRHVLLYLEDGTKAQVEIVSATASHIEARFPGTTRPRRLRMGEVAALQRTEWFRQQLGADGLRVMGVLMSQAQNPRIHELGLRYLARAMEKDEEAKAYAEGRGLLGAIQRVKPIGDKPLETEAVSRADEARKRGVIFWNNREWTPADYANRWREYWGRSTTSVVSSLSATAGQRPLVIVCGPDIRTYDASRGTPLIPLVDADSRTPIRVCAVGREIIAYVRQGKLVLKRRGNEASSSDSAHPVTAMALDPASTRLATAGSGPEVRVRSVEGRVVAQLRCDGRGGHSAVCWSPDGKRVLAAGARAGAVGWDVASGKQLFTLPRGGAGVDIATRQEDGAIAVAWRSGSRGSVTVYASDGKTQLMKAKLTRAPTCLAWSPDGNLLAVGDRSGRIHFYSFQWKLLRTFSPHRDGVVDLVFAQDSRSLFSSGKDKTLRRWYPR